MNFGVYLRAHCEDPIRDDYIGRPTDIVRFPAFTISIGDDLVGSRAHSSDPKPIGAHRNLIFRLIALWIDHASWQKSRFGPQI